MINYQIPDNAVRVEFYRDGDIAYMIVEKTVFVWLYDEVNKAGWCRMAKGVPDKIRANATRCETEHEAVTGRKPDEWISVEEGPPEPLVDVLAWADPKILPAWYGSDGFWYAGAVMGWRHALNNVTHWQPRPDPPRKPDDLIDVVQKKFRESDEAFDRAAEKPGSWTGPWQPIPCPKGESQPMGHVACKYSATGDVYKHAPRRCFIQIKDANIATFLRGQRIIDVGSVSNISILEVVPGEHGPWSKIQGSEGIENKRTAGIGPGLIIDAGADRSCDAIGVGDAILPGKEQDMPEPAQPPEDQPESTPARPKAQYYIHVDGPWDSMGPFRIKGDVVHCYYNDEWNLSEEAPELIRKHYKPVRTEADAIGFNPYAGGQHEISWQINEQLFAQQQQRLQQKQAKMTPHQRELAKAVKVCLDAGEPYNQLYKAKDLFKTAVDELLDAFLKAIGQ